MNLLIFLDLTYNLGKNFKFYSLQGQNFKIFLIFTYNLGKVFLILPITRGGGGGTCIPGLHWRLPPPWSIVYLIYKYIQLITKSIARKLVEIFHLASFYLANSFSNSGKVYH